MKRRPRRSGHALVGTMGFLTLAMLLWLVTQGQMANSLRTAKAVQERQIAAQGPTRAMAWGLALLETGLPPADPYCCKMTPAPGEDYVMTIARTTNGEYAIAVRPLDPNDGPLPAAPPTFASVPPP